MLKSNRVGGLLLLSIITFCACLLAACDSHRFSAAIAIPAYAHDRTTLRPDENQYGVRFSIDVTPYSYAQVDNLRRQIIGLGYVKCKKSAISAWQILPGQPSPDVKWLVEMFAHENGDSYAVLRVEQHDTGNHNVATQKFSVSFLRTGHGARNSGNIGEFCTLPR